MFPYIFYRDAPGDASECLMFRPRFPLRRSCRASSPSSVHTPAHKTSEFLDLIEQTDVVRLDADRSVGSSIFHGKKAEEIQTVRIVSSLPFVPCRSTWGESCPIKLPAAPGRGVADVLAARLTAPDLDYPREGLRRRLNRMPRSATNSITAILLNQWPRLSPTRKERQMTIARSPGDERADARIQRLSRR